LPGCGGQAPRAITGRELTSGGLLAGARRPLRGHQLRWHLMVVPRLTSLSSSGRTHRLTVSTSKPVSPVGVAVKVPCRTSVPAQSPRRAAARVRSISRSASRLATGLALVVGPAAPDERELELGPAVLEVEREGHERELLALGAVPPGVELVAVAGAACAPRPARAVVAVAEGVRGDVHALQHSSRHGRRRRCRPAAPWPCAAT
jgi:hypothetical protein